MALDFPDTPNLLSPQERILIDINKLLFLPVEVDGIIRGTTFAFCLLENEFLRDKLLCAITRIHQGTV